MEPVLATWQFVSLDPELAHGFVIGMFVLLAASSDLHVIYCPFVSIPLIKQQQILLLPGMPCSLLPCLIHMI
uniref:Uridine cytidine kinase I n=1 Tax=Solanum tuberosum TaxID=4113 RepID=M1BKL4_SOLTU